MSAVSDAERAFSDAWHADPLPGAELVAEHRFHPPRLWRFDFAFPAAKLAVEIEGRGRHQTVVGVRNDCEKYNTALLDGWRVLRFPATDKKMAREWVDTVKAALCGAGADEKTD